MKRSPSGNDEPAAEAGHPLETGSSRGPEKLMSADWDEVSYVISSSYRVRVLDRLADFPETPSRIARETDCPIAHISRALQGLRERGLVELLVSEHRKKGRVYGITEEGEAIWKTIEKQNMA